MPHDRESFICNIVFHNDTRADAKLLGTQTRDVARIIAHHYCGCNKPTSCFLMLGYCVYFVV